MRASSSEKFPRLGAGDVPLSDHPPSASTPLLLNDLLHSFLQIFDESCVQSFIGRVHTTLGGHSEHTISGSGRLYVRGERFRV